MGVCIYKYDFRGRCKRLTSQKTISFLLKKIFTMVVSKSLDKIATVVTLLSVEKIIFEEPVSQLLGSCNIVIVAVDQELRKQMPGK